MFKNMFKTVILHVTIQTFFFFPPSPYLFLDPLNSPCIFFLKFLINWFIYFWLCWVFIASCGEQGLLSSCGGQASHCGGFSCYTAQALGPSGCSSWTPRLESTGLVVEAHGLSCSSAWGIFLDQGWNTDGIRLHWQMDCLPLSHQRSSWF